MKADYYRCNKCGKLFQAYSWDAARVVVSDNGVSNTAHGDEVADYYEEKTRTIVCHDCRP